MKKLVWCGGLMAIALSLPAYAADMRSDHRMRPHNDMSDEFHMPRGGGSGEVDRSLPPADASPTLRHEEGTSDEPHMQRGGDSVEGPTPKHEEGTSDESASPPSTNKPATNKEESPKKEPGAIVVPMSAPQKMTLTLPALGEVCGIKVLPPSHGNSSSNLPILIPGTESDCLPIGSAQ